MAETPPEKKSLPYRFRETSFRNYENEIDAVVKAYPEHVFFRPANCETFACRLRDAMTSLLEHAWLTKIDLERLRQYRADIAVSIRVDGSVCVGPRGKAPSVTTTTMTNLTQQTVEAIANPSPEALEAIMVLHHTRQKQTPTYVRYDYPEADLQGYKGYWESRYDVAIEITTDKMLKIL